MTTNVVWLKIDGTRVLPTLEQAREKLDSADGEVVLDFSTVSRIDPGVLRAMERIADTADGKGSKAVLRGVNVQIYKVLKLMRLTSRFLFRN